MEKIIKEIIKNNKKISIIQNSDGQKLFRKLIINSSGKEILSLKNEIRCLKILKDTGIVPKIIDYKLDVETPYLITEYINFERLDKYNFLSLYEKLKCMIKILDTINVIHKNKIIHCDLKPQQIFIDDNLNVKIIDFGISSVYGKNILSNYGSINYCSPEKINKQKITTYSDIFSLGIIFYKLITGNLPFERDIVDIKKPIEFFKIKRLENNDLNEIFYKSINENYRFRYKSVEEFKNDLIKIINKRSDNMDEKFKKYLPIGSVVLLKDAKKRIMITGFAATVTETEEKVFDYVGCLYPEGVISSDKNLLFNHEQIEKIYYIGYIDEEWKKLEPQIKDFVSNKTSKEE